ncbi:MAG: tRNA (pseudouridine(54)-N(1))-methyltransferase TrmY [DPANN group archaeon]|nr:tRNA (pseudouridine(54)-N(1))-methyltransferase TrmY [DPANN group archaeon]
MIHFYVKSTKGQTSPDINLSDLAGSAGRLDIISRCINSALWLSNAMRRDVVFHTILHGEPNPPIYIRIEGAKLRKVQPDERNISIFLKKAIERFKDGKEIESTPGIFVSRKSFEQLIEDNKEKTFFLLSEEGKSLEPLDKVKYTDAFFILGDKEDLIDSEIAYLEKYKLNRVSLGDKSYLASHCITIVNWLNDKI